MSTDNEELLMIVSFDAVPIPICVYAPDYLLFLQLLFLWYELYPVQDKRSDDLRLCYETDQSNIIFRELM